MKRAFFLSLLVFMLSVQPIWAQIPQNVSYQGVLTDGSGTPVADGTYSLTFNIYDAATSATPIWTETHASVTVVSGIFNVIMGSVTPLSIAFDQQYWLGIAVGGGIELKPRIQLTSSAYSLNSQSVVDGAITTNKLANGAVTTNKLADNAVDANKIDDGAVTNIKLRDDSVTEDKIADSAVTAGKLFDSAVTTSKLRDDSVITDKLFDGAVTADKLADSAVTEGKIVNAAVSTNKLADNAVTEDKIVNAAVSTNKLADDAITTTKLRNNSVTVDKIQPDVVSSVDGVSNDGGNVNLVPNNTITITPNDASNTITIGETHSSDTSNPHNVTANQVEALASVEFVKNPGGNIDLVPGSNITITPDDTANTITISATGIASSGWELTGNAGTTPGTNFLGTTDNQALQLHVNNARALLLEPHATSPNFIGGYSGNSVTSGVYGANIDGGGENADKNRITDDYGTVGGGKGNQAGDNVGTTSDAPGATIGGGFNNQATGQIATVGGGYDNQATGSHATIGGGESNRATGNQATVGGGYDNRATDSHATVGGGYDNQATGSHDTIGGGYGNYATDSYATIGGGYGNQATGSFATIGGGSSNRATGTFSTVGGGYFNYADGSYSFAAGYRARIDAAHNGTFLFADYNDSLNFNSAAANEFAVRCTGGARFVTAISGSVPTAGVKVVAGATALDTVSNSALELRSNGLHALRLEPHATSPNLVGGYSGNYLSSGVYGATISGGGSNTYENRVTDNYGAIGGGRDNQAGGSSATIGGGFNNQAIEDYSTVGGGYYNQATGAHSAVGGGNNNEATGDHSTVGGGNNNEATGTYATVPGGSSNEANGNYSFAAGCRANADHEGSFVWGDSTNADVASTGNDRFAVRAKGGVYLYTNDALTAGVYIAGGSSSWSTVSDKAMKDNIRPVDVREVLNRLSSVPISRWNYKAQDPEIEHIGPMAQDFYAAFGLGIDDKHINTIDPDGVALAAIQGLYELVKEKDAEIAELGTEKAALESRVDSLEARLKALEAAK